MLFPSSLQQALDARKEQNLLRKLRVQEGLIDFCSNDYLGFARNIDLKEKTENKQVNSFLLNGATGSRLISGNSSAIELLEQRIAKLHEAEAALIFNSGYTANLGLLSSIGKKGDVFLYDELAHASLLDGMRLSHAAYYKFRHNDLSDLERLLKTNSTASNIYVVVESVYSMDGDLAPLNELVTLKKKYSFHLIVDEAHAIGVFGDEGLGLCEDKRISTHCFARIYTYGKAMGVHGAAVCGSSALRNYLINFSRPFIYTTALSPHAYAAIDAAYSVLQSSTAKQTLRDRITFFRKIFAGKNVISTTSAIQIILIPGNERVSTASEIMKSHGLDVRAIKSPTVKAGLERLRICLHAYNSEDEIRCLSEILVNNNFVD